MVCPDPTEASDAFIHSLIVPGGAPRAAKPQRAVAELLTQLGNPHRGLPVIHISGSKGKGSTALLIEGLLRHAGWRVGVYTSPHLDHWRERIRLDGIAVEPGVFAALIQRVEPRVRTLQAQGIAVGFFDVLTAAALLHFREQAVDMAVIEVGIGGYGDSTNVVEPRLSCLTAIELEHVERIGPTLRDIAWEKSGIIKSPAPLVSGPLPREAHDPIAQRVADQQVSWWQLGRDFQLQTRPTSGGQSLTVTLADTVIETSLPLLGEHQARNAALAIACGRVVGLRADRLATAAQGLAGVQLPGRCELLSQHPWVVVDAAHTADSAWALRAVMAGLPAQSCHLLLAFSASRNLAVVLDILLPVVETVWVTRADASRSVDPTEVAAACRAYSLPVTLEPDPDIAFRSARKALSDNGLLVVAGSFYLAARLRRALQR